MELGATADSALEYGPFDWCTMDINGPLIHCLGIMNKPRGCRIEIQVFHPKGVNLVACTSFSTFSITKY